MSKRINTNYIVFRLQTYSTTIEVVDPPVL